MSAAGLGDDRHPVINGVEFGLLALLPVAGVNMILANRQPNALAVLTPLDVVSAFGMPFLVVADLDYVGPNAAISGVDNGAITSADWGFDTLGEIDFLSLGVRHPIPRFKVESV